MQAKVNLSNLHELDGGAAGLVIDDAIRRAISDLDDRGADGKPRQVVIVVNMQKVPDNDAYQIHVEADAKLPKRRTGNTLAIVKTDKGEVGLAFQTRSPGNPYQTTIDELEKQNEPRE